MKKIILLLFLSLFGFGQEIKVSGVFVKHEEIKGEKVKTVIKNYSIYLLEDLNPNSKNKKKFESLDGNFEIILSKKERKKFHYLEFVTFGELAFCVINKLQDNLYIEVNSGDNLGNYYDQQPIITVGKPAIYLYPKVSTKVTIKNDFKGQVINTYPEYNNGWNIIAEPNGELLNQEDKRKYNYLFWDGIYSFTKNHFKYTEGFYVKKEENIKFLQEKLELIGLNNTEINDFIVYWLPELSKNEENFIHFWVNDNIDNSSILTINPNPDTLIRVYMEFKPYLGENKLPEQHLVKTERFGFTVVEWGGSNLDKPMIK